jgi:hypothetical protein
MSKPTLLTIAVIVVGTLVIGMFQVGESVKRESITAGLVLLVSGTQLAFLLCGYLLRVQDERREAPR